MERGSNTRLQQDHNMLKEMSLTTDGHQIKKEMHWETEYWVWTCCEKTQNGRNRQPHRPRCDLNFNRQLKTKENYDPTRVPETPKRVILTWPSKGKHLAHVTHLI